jgi:serine/threonine protein phosphatase PrpC
MIRAEFRLQNIQTDNNLFKDQEVKIIESCLKDSLIKLATSIEVSKTFSTDFSGTTLAAALIHGNHLLTCHLGDSRVIMISKIDSYYDSDMTA